MLAQSVVMFGGFAACILAWIFYIPRHWAGSTRRSDLRATPSYYPRWLARALRRSNPVVFAAVTLLTGAGSADVVGWALGEQDALRRPLAAVCLVALAAFPLIGLIVAVNRPKFLVAPHLREESGALWLLLPSGGGRRGGRRGTSVRSRSR